MAKLRGAGQNGDVGDDVAIPGDELDGRQWIAWRIVHAKKSGWDGVAWWYLADWAGRDRLRFWRVFLGWVVIGSAFGLGTAELLGDDSRAVIPDLGD